MNMDVIGEFTADLNEKVNVDGEHVTLRLSVKEAILLQGFLAIARSSLVEKVDAAYSGGNQPESEDLVQIKELYGYTTPLNAAISLVMVNSVGVDD